MREQYVGKVYIPNVGWVQFGQIPEQLLPALMERVRELPPGRKLIALWAIVYLEPGSRVASIASEEIAGLLGEDIYASFFQLTGFLMARGVPTPATVSSLLTMALGGNVHDDHART